MEKQKIFYDGNGGYTVMADEEKEREQKQYIANLEAQNKALRQRIDDIGEVIDELLMDSAAETLIALAKIRKIIRRKEA